MNNKRITLVACILWLLCLSGYSSMLIGTLAHELVHKQNSIDIKAIEINYDGSGLTKAKDFFPHDHHWVYLQGWIVFTILNAISYFSILILLLHKN